MMVRQTELLHWQKSFLSLKKAARYSRILGIKERDSASNVAYFMLKASTFCFPMRICPLRLRNLRSCCNRSLMDIAILLLGHELIENRTFALRRLGIER